MFDMLFDQVKLITYFLVVIRIGGLLFTVPIFSVRAIKPQIRMALAIIMGMVIFPFVPPVPFTADVNSLYLVLIILKELLIGIAIGAMTGFLFYGVQFGGYLVDFQMGFTMVNVVDPSTSSNVTFVSQVQNIMMILIFLAIGGHLLIVQSITKSFDFIPVGNFIINENAFMFAVKLFGKIFIVAITVVAPPLIALMATNAIMGVLARLVPQINLLVVGFPIKIAVGILMFMFSLPFFYIVFEKLMYDYFRMILEFFRMFPAK